MGSSFQLLTLLTKINKLLEWDKCIYWLLTLLTTDCNCYCQNMLGIYFTTHSSHHYHETIRIGRVYKSTAHPSHQWLQLPLQEYVGYFFTSHSSHQYSSSVECIGSSNQLLTLLTNFNILWISVGCINQLLTLLTTDWNCYCKSAEYIGSSFQLLTLLTTYGPK